jgi:hypothetical protein
MISNVQQLPMTPHLLGYYDTYNCEFEYENERYYFACQGGNTWYKRLTGAKTEQYGHEGGWTVPFAPFDWTTEEGQAAEQSLKNASGYVEPQVFIL